MSASAKQQLLALVKALQRRKGLYYLALLLLVVLVIVVQITLFGFGPTRRGGKLGRHLDNAIRSNLFERAARRHQEIFRQTMGYPLPDLVEKGANKVGVAVLLHSWLSEVLIRTKKRLDTVEQFTAESQTRANQCQLPFIHPMVGDWYRPIKWGLITIPSNETTVSQAIRALMFDDEQMEAFMSMHFEDIYVSFYQRSSTVIRTQLFGTAAVYVYGGIFLSPHLRDSRGLGDAAPGFFHWVQETRKDCKPGLWSQMVNDNAIGVLAATPQHPTVMCAMNELLVNRSIDWPSVLHLIDDTQWDPSCAPKCCRVQNVPADHKEIRANIELPEMRHDEPRFRVTIREPHGEPPPLQPKIRCSDRLGQQQCAAGWLCNRCLRIPFRGSLVACRFFCRSCYAAVVCVSPRRNQVNIDVSVTEKRNSSQKRIPRIIHQTWFEEISLTRYPHLHRLQNSWRASGWDYRFYNNSDCHEFIAQNYPQRFVDAYDAIIPGAFKADFFRLLVLFKEGGVYADVDIQLDADLDSFITKDLAFFVPRDVPLDYWPNSNYCLWNGLLGAAPGNPIIAKAIEDVVTTVLNRLDYYDVEGTLCSRDLDAEIWKLRTLPILILTGPCALGMSVNAALGRSNVLAGHDLGWLDAMNISAHHKPAGYFWGDALTLLTDRYDLGELRFTDIDRNVLVASSDQDRISKSPIKYGESSLLKIPAHYSKSESDIVGEHGTYKDDLTTNQLIRISISHEYVS